MPGCSIDNWRICVRVFSAWSSFFAAPLIASGVNMGGTSSSRHDAAHEIDERQGIRRNMIASPGDMLVRAREQERLLVDRRCLIADEIEKLQRHKASGCGFEKRLDRDASIASQKRVFRTHRIVKRGAAREADMGRAAA